MFWHTNRKEVYRDTIRRQYATIQELRKEIAECERRVKKITEEHAEHVMRLHNAMTEQSGTIAARDLAIEKLEQLMDGMTKQRKVLTDRVHELEDQAEGNCIPVDDYEEIATRVQNLEHWVIECSRVNVHHFETLAQVAGMVKDEDATREDVTGFIEQRAKMLQPPPVPVPGADYKGLKVGQSVEPVSYALDSEDDRLRDELEHVKAVRNNLLKDIEVLKKELAGTTDPAATEKIIMKSKIGEMAYRAAQNLHTGGTVEPVKRLIGEVGPEFVTSRNKDVLNEKG